MAGKKESPDILADSVGSTACPKCGHVVDVSQVPAFSTVHCPQCKAGFTAPGKVGQFILLRLLGRGEMGATYKARDKVLGRSVAVKVMNRSLGQDQKRVEDFLTEGRALASLDHPNAVRIFSLGQEKGQPYIVMELITGRSLDKKYSPDKAMDEALALEITIQIAQALQAADKIGLIHGDVKPANIMIDEKGRAKLVDFGIARFGGGRVAEGAALGTPYYVAPEQVLRESINHRTDIYSLGATLFHILACMPPFPGKTMKEVLQARLKKPAPDLLTIRPSLHRETAAVVAKMLQRRPDDRYETHEELLRDLRQAHRVVTGQAPAPQEAAGTPRRAGIRLAIGIAGAAAIAVVLAAGIVMRSLRPEGPKPPPAVVKQVALPVFSPPAGVITGPVEVTVACDTDGARIRYTTDGSDPTRNSPTFAGPIRVVPPATLKAKAYRDGWAPSPVIKAAYTPRKVTLIEIVPFRTDTLAAWQNAKKLARAGGMKARLDHGSALFSTAEEFYTQSDYDQAKAYYEKLAALCKEMEKLVVDRKPAIEARGVADEAIKALAALRVKDDREKLWREPNGQAKAAFDKGNFAAAERLWRAAAENAKARYDVLQTQVSYEWDEAVKTYDLERVKKYAPAQWRQVQQSLKQARNHEEKKDFPKARVFYKRAVQRLADADKVAGKAREQIEKTRGITEQIDSLLGEHKYREAFAKALAGLKEHPKNAPLLERKKAIEGKLHLTLELRPGRKDSETNLDVPPVLMKLTLIPPGKFVMGSPKNETGRRSDEKQHEVILTRPFYMSLREVTVRQFTVLAEENKDYKTNAEKSGSAMVLRGAQWRSARGISWRNPDFEQTPDHPVACVSWKDARQFCKWLTAKTKKKARLPTEAEWERACRGGTATRFAFGQKDEELHRHGNYADSSSGLLRRDEKNSDGHARTAPVGGFKTNAWGLHDMHGNVAEWCLDMYASYPRGPVTDPRGLASGKYPVLRGGSWFDLPGLCRSAARARYLPSFSSGITGFRVVVPAEE